MCACTGNLIRFAVTVIYGLHFRFLPDILLKSRLTLLKLKKSMTPHRISLQILCDIIDFSNFRDLKTTFYF